MSRTITILFCRQPAQDRVDNRVPMEGYRLCWPDGSPVSVGLSGFCKHGQRLLGLGKHLTGCTEKLIDLIVYPLISRDDHLNRRPGFRVRRFFVERQGKVGRIHFLDGTPTNTTFEMDRDDARVLHWIGLPYINDGDRQWIDMAAGPASVPPAKVPSPSQLVQAELYYTT